MFFSQSMMRARFRSNNRARCKKKRPASTPINSKPVPTVAILSEYPAHGSNHAFADIAQILIPPYKTPQQYPVPLHHPPQNWCCHSFDMLQVQSLLIKPCHLTHHQSTQIFLIHWILKFVVYL